MVGAHIQIQRWLQQLNLQSLRVSEESYSLPMCRKKKKKLTHSRSFRFLWRSFSNHKYREVKSHCLCWKSFLNLLKSPEFLFRNGWANGFGKYDTQRWRTSCSQEDSAAKMSYPPSFAYFTIFHVSYASVFNLFRSTTAHSCGDDSRLSCIGGGKQRYDYLNYWWRKKIKLLRYHWILTFDSKSIGNGTH